MKMRHFARVVLFATVAAASCGPERAATFDVERIKAEYCEKTAACAEDPDVDFDFCMQTLDEIGVYEGGWYDEVGCLDEEARFLECLTGMTCEDLRGVEFTNEGGPCYAEWHGGFAAGCPLMSG